MIPTMSTAPMTATTTGGFTEPAFEEFLGQRREPTWLSARRRTAFANFRTTPWPTARDEEWRRTDIRALKLASFVPPLEASASSESLQSSWDSLSGLYATGIEHVDSVCTRPVLANALPPGVIFCDLAQAVTEHSELIERHLLTKAVDPAADALSALHAAFWNGGTFLYVPKGVKLDAPLFTLVGMSTSGKVEERIFKASEDWEAQRMGGVPGETEFIPLPATRFTPAEPMS